MQNHEFKQHEAHGWVQKSTDHIRNVENLKTHRLMECPCGFFGWVLDSQFATN